MDDLRQRIQVALGTLPADLVLRNVNLINVCSNEIYPADVALSGAYIAGISAPGSHYVGLEERDLQGRWLAPGLLDGHMHIESTMLVLSEFARLVTPRGVTT